jgi:hypothetical protein
MYVAIWALQQTGFCGLTVQVLRLQKWAELVVTKVSNKG